VTQYLYLSGLDGVTGAVYVQRCLRRGECAPTDDGLDGLTLISGRRIAFAERRAPHLARELLAFYEHAVRRVLEEPRRRPPQPQLSLAARGELLRLVVEFPGLESWAFALVERHQVLALAEPKEATC
jgi:hypothetical protein